MNKKQKNNRHLFCIAVFASSLGYLKYKYSEFVKNNNNSITKEDALLIALTREVIDELSNHIKHYQNPKKMKKIIKLNNLAVDMTDTKDTDVYAFSIILLGIYFDDKTGIIPIETDFLYKVADIADIVFTTIGNEAVDKNIEIAETFYSNLKEVCFKDGAK